MKEYTDEILQSTKYVVDNSAHVHILEENISRFCEENPIRRKETDWLQNNPFPINNLDEKEKIHLMLTFNSLSFSYWGDPSWRVTHDNKAYNRGSWSLIAALMRAREEGIEILSPTIQANMPRKELEHVLRGNIEIPILGERLAILNQVGTVVSRDYNNDFRNMISGADYDATGLLSKIIKSFPLFEDTAIYNGKKICFYKRAQALVQSISSLEEEPLENADRLTALADYKLPVPLRDSKILSYSDELARIIDNKQLISKGSGYEVEIRANTIWAVEGIKDYLCDKGIKLNRKEINDYLWITADKHNAAHHRTRTTAY